MEHLFNIEYNSSKGQGNYSLSKEAPPNCFILNTVDLGELRKKEPNFTLYIGSIWDDAYLGVSNLLGVIALKNPDIHFYFKLVDNESELDSILPKSIIYQHLPVIVFVEKENMKLISSGPTNRAELEKKSLSLFSGNASNW